MTFILNDDKNIETYRYYHHHHQHHKEPVMKAEKVATTCTLDITGTSRVMTSVPVPVKRIKDRPQVQELVIKDGKGKRKWLLDGGKGIVNVQNRDDSWGMEYLEESQRNKISS